VVILGLHSRVTKRDIKPALRTILKQELHSLPQSSQEKFRKTLLASSCSTPTTYSYLSTNRSLWFNSAVNNNHDEDWKHSDLPLNV